MRLATNITLFMLLVSLHISIGGLFVEAQVLFYISAVAILCLSAFYSKHKPTLNFGSLIIAVFAVFIIASYITKGNLYGTYRTYFIITIWLLFFGLKRIFKQDKKYLRYVFLFIVVGAYIEIIFGFCQLFGWLGNDNDNFVLGGSLSNPGAFAGYLSVVAPMVLSMIFVYRRKKKLENQFYFLLTCLLFIIYFIITSQSRGAWIACLLGCGFVLDKRFSLCNKVLSYLHTPIRKIISIIAAVSLFGLISFALYQFKADSANGRLFIWKVAMTTPHKNLLTGDGLNSFEANYGKWQMDYFANNRGSETERYVADYVMCAYNEFLETYIEQGLFGLMFLVGLLIVALSRRNTKHSPLFSGTKGSLIAIIVLCFVSYPLQTPLIYLQLIISLSIIFCYQKEEPVFQINTTPLRFACPILNLFIAYFGLQNLYGYHLLREGQKTVFLNPDKAIINYEKAYPILRNNGTFLFYYGSALALSGRCEESIEMLEQAKEKSSMPNIFILLGDNYKKISKFEAAKTAYLDAIHSVPSRLYPKYQLVQLLMETSQKAEAYAWANEILATKDKVSTTAAKEIKDEMSHLLKTDLSNFKTDLPMVE